MSVVVAIKKDGVIYMGADSQVTKGGSRTTLSNPNNYKIWALRDLDHAVMGSVGTLRAANIMKVADGLIPEIVALRGDITFRFVVKQFVPSLMDELAHYKQLWVVIVIVVLMLIFFLTSGASWEAVETLLAFGLISFFFARSLFR